MCVYEVWEMPNRVATRELGWYLSCGWSPLGPREQTQEASRALLSQEHLALLRDESWWVPPTDGEVVRVAASESSGAPVEGKRVKEELGFQELVPVLFLSEHF